MLSWATKRRLIYGGSVVVVLALIFGGIFWKIFYQAPTCNDGRQNGDEKGVDCGGSCRNLCTSDALTPVVLWSKVFNVSGDVYSAVAYIENPNVNSRNNRATYQFQIYDKNNKLITVKEGETSIPKGKKFAVFETSLLISNSKPKSADFKFLSFSPWEKDIAKEPEITLKYGTIVGSTTPSITGSITSQSIGTIPEIELVVFVLDRNENAIGASRTFIDNLSKNAPQDFVFSWQKPFEGDSSVISVIYRSI
ncbi:hypothetical protein H0W91_02070 [Patescibacteria group bacterium]|nr:hypothetical protein [Patescibacteria group bacterium]